MCSWIGHNSRVGEVNELLQDTREDKARKWDHVWPGLADGEIKPVAFSSG